MTRPRPGLRPGLGVSLGLTLLLGTLSAVGPLSTDMYLPAFPRIGAEFGGGAQLTLAAWFAGLACGQMMQGVLADRFGRRVPLLAGTALYTLASAGCALAPGLVSFSVWRLLAALGASASMVVPRAVVRDLTEGAATARLLARLMLVTGVVPILAPTLGGALLAVADWRVIFWVATVYGVVSCALVWRYLPDTLPETMRIRLSPAGIVARYAAIGMERSFATNALAGAAGMAGMFAYLAGSPGLFIGLLHFSPTQYGMVFGANAAGFIAAAQVNARLVGRLGVGRVVRLAARTLLAAALALGVVALSGRVATWTVMPPISLAVASLGFLMPAAVAAALARHAAHAASASALMGTWQFALGAASSTLAGLLANGTAVPMAALLLACALVAAGADWARR